MKRLILISFLLIMASAAALFAQDAAQPQAQVQQETKKEVKQPASNGTTAFTLGEIVVRDRNIPNIEDASTTTDISGKDIENRGDKSLADTLQMVPGINVTGTAKGFTGFQLRGFDHDKVAILIDGMPVIDPYYGGNNIDISTIPVSNVSRVVVNRGAASALYGALGSIGSINIITKKPEKLTAAAKVEYGQHQNYTINAEAGAPIGNFYTWVNASIQNSNGYEISGKLDSSERRRWFDKLVQYGIYGQSFDSVTIQSKNAYLNDDGLWNHTSYRKYQASGRIGYNFTDKIEAGLSASYYSNEQESNTFASTTTLSWKNTDWSTAPSFTSDGKSAALQNRAFSWPEDTRLTLSPYFRGVFGDLTIRLNTFYIAQRNNLESWANADETLMMFPLATYNPSTGKPYGTDQVQSIFEETSYGFFLLPTYRLASWNTLSATVHFRVEQHEKYEKAINSTLASNVVTIHGDGEYIVHDMEARFVTIALEDNMNFTTNFGFFNITAGISYDAQDITTLRNRSSNKSDGTCNQMVDQYIADDDSYIFGTRDSFNPVLGVVYDPIRDFLRFRVAGAMKTKFPSLSIYNDITEPTDRIIEPERIYSANAGFELFFLNNAISFRNDYFYTRIDDKIQSLYYPEAGPSATAYFNIDGYVAQGIETTISGRFERIAGIMDVDVSMGYIFTHARNHDDSTATRGEEVENTPVHQIVGQCIVNFITNTRLTIWGNYTRNQIVYVMESNPSTTSPGVYTQDVYTTVELHNPFMLHIKVQQDLPYNTYVYAMCRNVLDDYDANPFNPGPGRMFYFGGGGRL